MSGFRADRRRFPAALALAAVVLGPGLAGAQVAARSPTESAGPLILGPIGRPPPPDAVRSEPLAPLDPAVGVSRPDASDPGTPGGTLRHDAGPGLGEDLWTGSRRADIAELIGELPPRIDNTTLNRLVRRALASPVDSLEGPATATDLTVLRVAALATLGDLDGASALVDSVPERDRGEDLHRVAAEVDLLRYNIGSACATAGAAISRSTSPYWQKLVAFCQIGAGWEDEASLLIELLRDQGHRDPAFFAFADTLLGFRTARTESLPALEPLHLAMLRAAGLPVPADAAENAKPALLRTIALLPDADPTMRLTAAEEAVAANALDPAVLGDLYLAVGDGDGSMPRSEVEGVSADSAAERAALFRTARWTRDAVGRAAALRSLFQAARQHGILRPVAEISTPLLQELQPSGRLSFFAGEAARAAIATGNPALAVRWFELAVREAPGNQLAARSAAEVWPLLMLAVPGTAWSDEFFGRWQEQLLDAEPAEATARASIFLVLLDALETRVPQHAWSLLPAPMPDRGFAVPGLRALTTAAERGRRGETLLRIATVLASTDPSGTPARLHAAVRALRSAGFAEHVRPFAVDAALAAGI